MSTYVLVPGACPEAQGDPGGVVSRPTSVPFSGVDKLPPED